MDSPDLQSNKQRVVQRLLDTLRGFEVVETGQDAGVDVLLQERRTGRRVAVEVKLLSARRVSELPSALALASYELREAADRVKAEPLLVFGLPRWNASAVLELRAFTARFGLAVGWAVFSDDAGGAVSMPGFQLERSVLPRLQDVRMPRIRQSVDPFTDANRWMLKVLLLRNVEAQFWGGTRDECGGVLALSRAAGVTPESAYRFARSLQSHGFARLERGAFELLETGRLLDQWLSVDANKPLLWQPVRWTRGKPDHLAEVFGRDTAGPRYAVTNYEACRRLGLLHATVGGIDVQVDGDLGQAMQQWKLEPVPPHEGHFRLARARFPRSVFGGRVWVDGVAVADAFQVALDVRSHPARGVEQSDYILESLRIER